MSTPDAESGAVISELAELALAASGSEKTRNHPITLQVT